MVGPYLILPDVASCGGSRAACGQQCKHRGSVVFWATGRGSISSLPNSWTLYFSGRPILVAIKEFKLLFGPSTGEVSFSTQLRFLFYYLLQGCGRSPAGMDETRFAYCNRPAASQLVRRGCPRLFWGAMIKPAVQLWQCQRLNSKHGGRGREPSRSPLKLRLTSSLPEFMNFNLFGRPF